MNRFVPGAVARLREVRGEPWDQNRIEYVFVLVQPDPPYVAARPELSVAPICFAVEQATDLDLICPVGEGGLDRPYLVELWNQGVVLAEELEDAPFGQAAPQVVANAYAVHNSMVDASEVVPDGITGPPIEVETDPRIQHQAHRTDLAEHLSSCANALLLGAAPTARQPGQYAAEQPAALDWPDDGQIVRPWMALVELVGAGAGSGTSSPFQGAPTGAPKYSGNVTYTPAPDLSRSGASSWSPHASNKGRVAPFDPFNQHPHDPRYVSAANNNLAFAV